MDKHFNRVLPIILDLVLNSRVRLVCNRNFLEFFVAVMNLQGAPIQ